MELELELLLQATSERSEDIRLERSWCRGRGSSLAGVFLDRLVKLKSWTSCCRLLKTSVAGEAGEVKEMDVLLQAARPREGSEDI